MPGKGLFSSLTEKAQAAVAGTPLASRLSSSSNAEGHGTGTTGTGGQSYNPPTQEQSGTLSGRHHGLESLQHTLRTLQVQYSSGISQENRQLQLLITASKGVALDYDAIGRDSKSQSKELYLWGQSQGADIKDVTDRLAYLNFVHGALSYTLATDIDKSRASWKNVRDAEAALAPRRAQRANLIAQINKLKTEGGRTGNVDSRLADLDTQLKKAIADDEPLERELELLKRTAIRESEGIKWKALSEYAHKLLLLSNAAEQLLRVLPSSPPATPEDYTGHQQTAAVRASLQNALDSDYVPKVEYLPLNTGAALNIPEGGGETRSFGETHAEELNTITTTTDNGHETPDHSAGGRKSHDTVSAPVHPASLNNAPAPIPGASSSAHHYAAPSVGPGGHYAPPSTEPPSTSHYEAPSAPPAPAASESNPPSSQTSVPKAPTVAETGVPVTAGAEGPGPASGNLHDTHADTEQPPGYGGAAVGHESAEAEKRRLASGEHTSGLTAGGEGDSTLTEGGRQGGLVASTSTRRPPGSGVGTAHETAEDEKKRLEREERERVLQGQQQQNQGQSGPQHGSLPQREPTQYEDGAPPPPAYQD